MGFRTGRRLTGHERVARAIGTQRAPVARVLPGAAPLPLDQRTLEPSH